MLNTESSSPLKTKQALYDRPIRHNDPEIAAMITLGRDVIRLQDRLRSEGDGLVSMILACIACGIDTRDEIIASVPRFCGYRYGCVARKLGLLEGQDPESDPWYRDVDGHYHIHGLVEPRLVSRPLRPRRIPADLKSCEPEKVARSPRPRADLQN